MNLSTTDNLFAWLSDVGATGNAIIRPWVIRARDLSYIRCYFSGPNIPTYVWPRYIHPVPLPFTCDCITGKITGESPHLWLKKHYSHQAIQSGYFIRFWIFRDLKFSPMYVAFIMAQSEPLLWRLTSNLDYFTVSSCGITIMKVYFIRKCCHTVNTRVMVLTKIR